MKCYYEILEVAREADDSEIKTAYRKLALRWHPDKNIDDTESAKEQFQLVQQAYEVLSDRQERAWYDNHREQILRGSDSNYEDDSLDVFLYFTTQCFKGYNDDEKGFYTVYRNVFEKIAKEDIEYMDSKSDFDEIPIFGTSSSDYEDIVGPFYAYWMSYTTRKSYVWLDPYNIKETRERRVAKLIEKENKKVRQKAKKERNEEIRNLVAFVRKRDKRVEAHAKLLEAKNAENRQKQEHLRKEKLLQRKKEMHTKPQAEWSKFDNVQLELKQIEKHLAEQFGEYVSDSESNSEEEECEDLYCVACNKIFKNPKAFANHESSKKHRENVEKLKMLVREEEEEYKKIEEEDELDQLTDEELEMYTSSEAEETVASSKKKNKKTKNVIRIQDEYTSEENHELSEKETEKTVENLEPISDTDEISISSKKKNKKNKKVIQIQDDCKSEENHDLSKKEAEKSIETLETISDTEDISTSSKKKNKKNKKVIRMKDEENHKDIEKPESISEDDFDFGGNSKKQKKKISKNKNSQINKTNPETNNGNIETNDNTTAKKLANNKIKLNKKLISIDVEDIDTSHCCVICKSNFNSKNKLFEHLKKTGHSVLIPQKAAKAKRKQVK